MGENFKRKILIVEDNKSLAIIIQRNLLRQGYDSHVAFDVEFALKRIFERKFDLVICDLILPGKNGVELLNELHNSGVFIPFIIITTFPTDENEIEAFNNNVSIFHRKPIKYSLLFSQIKMLLRDNNDEIMNLGDLQIDIKKRIVLYKDNKIMLTRNEFRLLRLLLEKKGEVISRKEIISKLRLGNYDAGHGTVDTLVSRLRNKLKTIIEHDIIETVYGFGYKVNEEFD